MLIPKHIFKIREVASTDPTCYQLNGVFLRRLEEKRCEAAATNGKILAVVQFEDHGEDFPASPTTNYGTWPDFSMILASKDTEAAEKAAPKLPMNPLLESVFLDETSKNGNGTVKLETTDLDTRQEMNVHPVAGIYPAYWTAFDPIKYGEPVVKLDIDMTIQALKVLKSQSQKNGHHYFTVQMTPNEGKFTRPLLLRPAKGFEKPGIDAKVYLMPVIGKTT